MLGELISGGANLVGGIISAIAGGKQRREGRRLLKNIGDEVVPQELLDNQLQAKQAANEGLPSAQYAQAMKNIQRQQLMALRGANDRRGGLAAISAIQQGGNDASLNLDVADAQARRQNERFAMGVNNQVGNFKNSIWERKYNYGQQLLGTGNQNTYGGIDKIVAGAGEGLYGALSGMPRTRRGNNYNMSYGDFQLD